ncbi:hypothetical protein KEM52_000882, partial [Ascosphaera acerosa]
AAPSHVVAPATPTSTPNRRQRQQQKQQKQQQQQQRRPPPPPQMGLPTYAPPHPPHPSRTPLAVSQNYHHHHQQKQQRPASPGSASPGPRSRFQSANAFSKLAELETARKTPSPDPQQRRRQQQQQQQQQQRPLSGPLPLRPLTPQQQQQQRQLREHGAPAQPGRFVPRTKQGQGSGMGQGHGHGHGHGYAVIQQGKQSFRSGHPPTMTVDLPVQYSQLKELRLTRAGKRRRYSILGGLPGLPPGIAGELQTFNYITERAGAYVPPPRDDAHTIDIWGPPHQAHDAAAIIRSLLFPRPDAPPPHPHPHPHKQPHGGSTRVTAKGEKFAITNQKAMQKAELAEFKRQRESLLETLREKPDNPSRFSESLLFLWPDDEFPMAECLGGDSLRDFDDLRQRTGCHIYIDDVNPSCIRADGDDPAKISRILQGLRLHWAGLLAKTNVKVKAYLVQIPPVRADVGIEVRARRGREIHVPRPHDPERGYDPVQWEADAKFLHAKNQFRLREGVQRSLQALKYSKGHLRMRVTFGTFVLREYQKLRDGRTRYTFEEFRKMLLLSRTKGYLDPELSTEHRQALLSRCLQRKDLLTLFNPRHNSLEGTLPSYTITFHFQEGSASLRLDVEFNATPQGGYERGNKTWFKTASEDAADLERPILQVGVIDFERSDWELDVSLRGEPTDNAHISRSLKEFANSVVLQRSEMDDPSAPGRLRCSFPVEHAQNLRQIRERTALRYRVAQTNYILEIARDDTFACTSMAGAYDAAGSFVYGVPRVHDTAVTTWGASLYDTTWDERLGQNATSRRGENVQWKPSFKSFFPASNGNSNGASVGVGVGTRSSTATPPATAAAAAADAGGDEAAGSAIAVAATAEDDIYAGFGEFLELVTEIAQMLCPEHKLPPCETAEAALRRDAECKRSPALEDIRPFEDT